MKSRAARASAAGWCILDLPDGRFLVAGDGVRFPLKPGNESLVLNSSEVLSILERDEERIRSGILSPFTTASAASAHVREALPVEAVLIKNFADSCGISRILHLGSGLDSMTRPFLEQHGMDVTEFDPNFSVDNPAGKRFPMLFAVHVLCVLPPNARTVFLNDAVDRLDVGGLAVFFGYGEDRILPGSIGYEDGVQAIDGANRYFMRSYCARSLADDLRFRLSGRGEVLKTGRIGGFIATPWCLWRKS